jgi:PAS domain S-box-containing protein
LSALVWDSARIREALSSCAIEADLVQVLYAALRALFGYDVVVMHVLERDGWYHMVAVDHGVLQDTVRRRLEDSMFAENYSDATPAVLYPTNGTSYVRGRGPGGGKKPQTVIWLPILDQGQTIGSVIYQIEERRQVEPEELAVLGEIHSCLGERLQAAHLNELTRSDSVWASDRAGLLDALSSCATEADIVQVLYAALHRALGYDTVNLHVLEREGWYHYRAFDHGVLQDVGRRRLSESYFAGNYRNPQASVIYSTPDTKYEPVRGFGVHLNPQTLIWVPILQQGVAIGSVIYQLDVRREVSIEELAFLKDVHSRLGPIVSAAYLNELTRNQAISLRALNSIARSLATTHNEDEIVEALRSALASLLAVDVVELVVREEGGDGAVRILQAQGADRPVVRHYDLEHVSSARDVFESGQSQLRTELEVGAEHPSAAWVPVRDGNEVRAVLSVHSKQSGQYEQSTIVFLEQVADELALALRNAWTYAAVEANRRRLEVVEAVGRRLASSLDRWSIMRAVREELARHLNFDFFTVATIAKTPAGPIAEGYVFDSGVEQPLVAVPLAEAGPSREAYESGQPVLIGRSPWARSFATAERTEGGLVHGDGAVLQLTRQRSEERAAARSMVWVPVRHGTDITALLSLQSYTANSFSEWHMALLQDVAAHVSLALATAEHVEARDGQARMMEAILTHSPVGMVLEDALGIVLYVNAEVERIYGREAESIVGRPASQLLTEIGANLISDLDSEPGGPLEYQLGRKDLVVEVRRVPIRGLGDHRTGVLSLHEDVTRERSLLEDKDLMLRAIGHEVRSPAAAMRSTLASVLQWGSAIRNEQRQMLVEEAYEQSDRLLRLVESQLIIAKLETNRFEANPVPVTLGSALDQVLRILTSRYGGRAGVVRCQLPADLPKAYCEPAHLDQVLANLLGNALEYTQASQVLVNAEARGRWLEVTVEDNGGGLPVSRRDSLFAKTGLAGQNRARGGLGLGLYLCRLVVERSFGGRIWLDRTGPSGTAFKFTLPAAAQPSPHNLPVNSCDS